jgi:hypothetical protein
MNLCRGGRLVRAASALLKTCPDSNRRDCDRGGRAVFRNRVAAQDKTGLWPRCSLRYNLPQMKFAKITFSVAFIWGLLILTPLYFMFNTIGRQDPPPITHPGFYYGFLSAGLAWQFVFVVVGRDPVRFRPMMLPSVLEKFGYAASLGALYLQRRLHDSDLAFAGVDLFFGILFLLAFISTAPQAQLAPSGSV